METKEVKSLKQKTAIICECGYVVTGISDIHAKSGLKRHKKSALHKRFMDMKKNSSMWVVSADNKKEEARTN